MYTLKFEARSLENLIPLLPVTTNYTAVSNASLSDVLCRVSLSDGRLNFMTHASESLIAAGIENQDGCSWFNTKTTTGDRVLVAKFKSRNNESVVTNANVDSTGSVSTGSRDLMRSLIQQTVENAVGSEIKFSDKEVFKTKSFLVPMNVCADGTDPKDNCPFIAISHRFLIKQLNEAYKVPASSGTDDEFSLNNWM